MRIVVLDASPLGLLTYAKGSPVAARCSEWLESLLVAGAHVVLPEIADYEVRRELLRLNRSTGLQRLDALTQVRGIAYLPITTQAMLRAAEYWAEARRRGRPTADPKALDGDAILAAQATLLAPPGNDVIIATANVGHLSLFAHAADWQSIVA